MSAQPLGIRIVSNPRGKLGERFSVDGFEIEGSLEADRSGGQSVPEQALEGGYNVRGRNVVNPEEGTLTGAVRKEEVSALKRSYRKQELVSIVGPEGTVPEAFIESVERTHSGGYYNKVDVSVKWKQARLAELGSVTVEAVTADAKHSPNSGSEGHNGGQPSFLQSQTGNQNQGGSGGGGGGKNVYADDSGDGSFLDNIGDAIAGALGGGGSDRGTLERRQQSSE